MSAKYCMKCGTKNELDASFCKKCAGSFSSSKAPAPTPVMPDDDEGEKLQRLRKRKRPVRAAIEMPQEQGFAIELPDDQQTQNSVEDEDEGEGISLNHCPQVTRLEIESIQTDTVQGISFGQLVAQAQQEKAQRGEIPQP